MWRKNVEQWRQYVIWEGQGAPADLLLSIINNESGGSAGEAARVGTKVHLNLPNRAGGSTLVKRAYGLMQTIPAVISDFNDAHPKHQIYFEDIAGRTGDAGRLQIRAGAWLLNKMVRRLNDFWPEDFPARSAARADPEQLSAALVAYARGLGALNKKFQILKDKGLPLTQKNLYEHFPLWGYDKVKAIWVNRPLYYASKVWRGYQKNKSNAPGLGPPPANPSGQPPQTIIAAGPKKPSLVDTSFGVPILLLLGVVVATKFFGKN